MRWKNIDEIRNYFIKWINQNEVMSKKHQDVCGVLNYIVHLLYFVFIVTGCVSISTFASLVHIPVGIASSARGFKVCVIARGITKYKTIIQKKKKKNDKIVLSAK